jgi:hypothetical protein
MEPDEDLDRGERREALREMLESPGWAVALASLRQKLVDARETYESNPRLTFEEMHAERARINFLKELIYNPREFLGPGDED